MTRLEKFWFDQKSFIFFLENLSIMITAPMDIKVVPIDKLLKSIVLVFCCNTEPFFCKMFYYSILLYPN